MVCNLLLEPFFKIDDPSSSCQRCKLNGKWKGGRFENCPQGPYVQADLQNTFKISTVLVIEGEHRSHDGVSALRPNKAQNCAGIGPGRKELKSQGLAHFMLKDAPL